MSARIDEIGDLTVTTDSLMPLTALELLAEIGTIADLAGGAAAIANTCKRLAGGNLRRLLPQVLGATRVSYTDDAGKSKSLTLGSPEAINQVFHRRMEHLPAVVRAAIEVSFVPFGRALGASLEGTGLLVGDSADSSPST